MRTQMSWRIYGNGMGKEMDIYTEGVLPDQKRSGLSCLLSLITIG